MKKIALLLCLLPHCLLAQNKTVDSLEKALLVTKADTQKARILNHLSSIYLDTGLTRGLAYANRALILSRQIKYGKGEADALANRGHIETNQLKNDLAKADFKAAIAYYKKHNNYTDLGYAYIDLGMILRPEGRGSESLIYFQQAADIFEKINNLEGSSDCLVLLANNYNSIRQYDKALPIYKKSYDLRIKIHDTNKAAQSLAGIGITYREMLTATANDGYFKLAIQYFGRARAVFINLRNTINLAFVDKEIAIVYGIKKIIKTHLFTCLKQKVNLTRQVISANWAGCIRKRAPPT